MTSSASEKPRAFPWDEVIAFCLGEIGLAPRDMWAATPLEVAAMVHGRRHAIHGTPIVPPKRGDFADLAALYPDTQ